MPSALRLAADGVVVLHVGFVVFVMLGGFLVFRWRRLIWLHVPAAIWGAAVELGGWTCPLTPIENYLRQRSGLTAYDGDFIERYLLPLLYPAHLTRELQAVLGSVVVAVNAFLYWRVFRARLESLRRG